MMVFFGAGMLGPNPRSAIICEFIYLSIYQLNDIKSNIILIVLIMHKSSTTAKAQYYRTNRSNRQKQASMNYSKNLFDVKNSSDSELTKNQNITFTLQQIKNRAKVSIIDFIKTQTRITAINQEIFKSLQEISTSLTIQKIFQNLYSIFRKVFEQQYKHHNEEKELLITVRAKQSTRIKLIKQQDPKKKTKTGKQVDQLQKINQQLKKELFQLKQEKTSLQKRIIGLIEQYQKRKKFYVAQIKKLTDIITTSPSDIRQLVLIKTKQARELQQRQQKSKQEKLSSLSYQGNIRNEQTNIAQVKKPLTAINFSHLRQESIAYQSQYTSDRHPLKNITSIQKIQQSKNDLD